ncbi:hypothetical protein Dimus_003911 [Dionaea muscipula]
MAPKKDIWYRRRSREVGCDSRSPDIYSVLVRGLSWPRPPRFRRPPPSLGIRVNRGQRTPYPMLLTSSDSEEPCSSEDGDSKEAIVTTSSEEYLLDSEGNRLPRSHVPNLSPILEIENSKMGFGSSSSKIDALPCASTVIAGGSEDGMTSIQCPNLVSIPSTSLLVNGAEEFTGTVFDSAENSEFVPLPSLVGGVSMVAGLPEVEVQFSLNASDGEGNVETRRDEGLADVDAQASSGLPMPASAVHAKGGRGGSVGEAVGGLGGVGGRTVVAGGQANSPSCGQVGNGPGGLMWPPLPAVGGVSGGSELQRRAQRRTPPGQCFNDDDDDHSTRSVLQRRRRAPAQCSTSSALVLLLDSKGSNSWLSLSLDDCKEYGDVILELCWDRHI